MWFKFGEVHSDDLNIKVLRIRKPFLPDFQDQREYVPGKDGSIVYPQPFRELTIEIDCLILYSNRHKKVAEDRNLAKLYSYSEQKLILSDESDVFYIGKLGGIFQPDRHKTLSSFTIEFICQPFKYGPNRVVEISSLPGTFMNAGTYYSQPIITILLSSSTNSFTLKVNGNELKYTSNISSSDIIVIDCQNYEFRINDELKVLEVSGFFSSIAPGENTIEITGATASNVKIEYQELYL